VQRKLRIGYNRAPMIEAMEAAGVVSAMNSNGGREVLHRPRRRAEGPPQVLLPCRVHCSALSLCVSAFADAPRVARLGELLAGMRSIEASFHQQLNDGSPIQESAGRVVLADPGRFR
jgi:hypothetical protein